MNKPVIGSVIVIAAAAAGAITLDTSPRAYVVPAPVAPLRLESERPHFPLALPERESLAPERGAAFAAASWAPPPALPSASKPPVQSSASAGVSAPPMPYRFVGTVARGTEVEYILAKGDTVIPVKQGETLDGAYRVEAITAGTVTLLYLPLEERTTLVLTAPSHRPVIAANSGAQPPSFPPLAPQSSTTQVNTPPTEARPGIRAAQLRGPRTAAK